MEKRVREFYDNKEAKITNAKKLTRENFGGDLKGSKKSNTPEINKKSKQLSRTYDDMMR